MNRRRTVRVLLAAATTAFAGAAVPAAGTLVAVGGRLSADNEAVFRAILDGDEGDGPVCVLPTASETPGRSMRSYVRDFERHGGRGAAIGVRIEAGDVATAGLESTARRLRACGGFFFTGGDQSRIVDTLRPGGAATAAFLAIRERFEAGAVVAGSSAGAAMMSDPMIGSGDAEDALRRGVTSDPDAGGVWIRPGMGFVRDAITDQHHLARGRFPRLLVAVADPATPDEGWGIDEDTALIVAPDGGLRVVGRSAAVLLRLARAGGAGARTGTLALLADGDRRDPEGTVVPAEDKVAPARAPATPVPARPWVGDAFHRFLLAWCASGEDRTSVPAADGELRLAKPAGFRAWVRERDGSAESDPFAGAGCGPIALDWRPRGAGR